MSARLLYDALPYNIPRHIRSSLLRFDIEEVDQDAEPRLAGRILLQEEANIPEFEYTSLPTDKKRIRLVRLLPGVLANPQIDCEMFEADFEGDRLVRVDGKTSCVTSQEQNVVEYEALSWRWGNEADGEYMVMIHRGGAMYRKRVSKTLGLALKYLRFEKDRYLWIDALCINQDDQDERSLQVTMMSLVYTAAERACVWLGEEDDDSTTAIKFIREEITQLKKFDRLCTDKEHASKWRSLLALMQRPWFSRRWVVQEIVLAKKATVYCGPDKIEWPELAIAVELFVEVETATHRLSKLMKKDDTVDLIPNWFEHISELGASLLVNATAKVYRTSELTKLNDGMFARKGVSRRNLLSLEYLVTSLSIFDCGRPHDSVYALVAIARDARPSVPPALIAKTEDILVAEIYSHFMEQKSYVLDYNSPYTDVCKDFTQFCIERCASIDMVQALDILCRPWAKDWLPEEDIPHDRKIPKPPEDPLMKRKEPWMIRIKAGKLRDKLKEFEGANDKEKLSSLLKDMGLSNTNQEITIPDGPNHSEEVVEIKDDRDNAKYREYGRTQNGNIPVVEGGVRSVIKQWFPDEQEEAKKNKPIKTKQELDGLQKISSKRTRIAAKNGESPVVANGADAQETGVPCPAEYELNLPSWVARISAAPFDIFAHPGMDIVKMGRKNADPLVGVPLDGHRNYSAGQTKKIDLESLKFRKRPRCHHYSLYVKGFWLDTVKSVAQVSQGGAIPGEWLDMAGWPEALRPQKPGEVLKDPPTEFWRTIVADRGMFDKNPPYYYSRACKETIIKGGLKSGAVDTTALIYNERNSIVAEFCRRVQAVIWNRALIKTEKGNLGLASDKVKVGDMVCILYGCTVPIILRKNAWKSRGERELEKFEDGVEAMKRLVRKCKKNRARRAHWDQKTTKKKERKEVEDIRQYTEIFNRDEATPTQWAYEKDIKSPYPSDYESEDVTDAETEGEDAAAACKEASPRPSDHESEDSPDAESSSQGNAEQRKEKEQKKEKKEPKKGRKEIKQEKAAKRDPYRHYEFFGGAYIHGMMDGEAVRQNFYKLKPDHLFELR